jgi:hypothetical protein
MQFLMCLGLLRKFVTSAIVLALLLTLAYALFCYRVDQLGQVADNAPVLLVGNVRAAYDAGPQDGAYELEDATGVTFVSTNVGLPQQGSFVLLWGVKASTGTGRPMIREHRRAGSF